MQRLRGALAATSIGTATAIVILGAAVALLLNPIWVGAGQDRAESGLLTGYGPADLRAATGAILSDLVLGPPDFAVEVNGEPVLNERERGHMRDVRSVFVGFFTVVLVALAVLVIGILVRRRSPAFWRRVARGGRALAVIVLVGGFIGLLFFDAAFEAFHQIFFPGGSYTFDPETERLVQLFPNQFWVETTIAAGALAVILGYAVSSWAGGRARRIEAERWAAATAGERWPARTKAAEAPASAPVPAAPAPALPVGEPQPDPADPDERPSAGGAG